jgi:hypothetical protein
MLGHKFMRDYTRPIMALNQLEVKKEKALNSHNSSLKLIRNHRCYKDQKRLKKFLLSMLKED